MKTNFLKTARCLSASFLVCCIALSLYSCKEDPITYPALTLEKSSVTVNIGYSATVGITDGSGEYSVESDNPEKAEAVLNGSEVEISGVSMGSATIKVRDVKSKETKDISVTVGVDDLTLDTTEPIYIEYGKTVEIGIMSGSGDYSVSVAPVLVNEADYNIASAAIENESVKINVLRVAPNGLARTTMTVTDNVSGQSATLDVRIVSMYLANSYTFANLTFNIDAAEADRAGVWIDWNNNGTRDQDESIAEFGVNFSRPRQSEVIFYGKITQFTASNMRAEILNLSNNIYLKSLTCNINQLTSLDLTNNPELTYLSCGNNSNLADIDFSKNPKLETILASSTSFTVMDVSNNYELKDLRVITAKLTEVKLGDISKLEYLYLWNNYDLVSVNTGKLTNLLELNLANNSAFTGLDVQNNTKLTLLNISKTGITSLNLSKQTELKTLYTGDSKITTASYLSAMPNPEKLETLSVYANQLTSLDVSRFTNLATLECQRNNLNGSGMDEFIGSLPSRVGKSLGKLVIIDTSPLVSPADQNVATVSHVTTVTGKNWQAWNNNTGGSQIPYSGS